MRSRPPEWSSRTRSSASSRTGTSTPGIAIPGGRATFRLDRMRSAESTGATFEPRADYDPSYLSDPRVARILYAKPVAR